MGIDPEEDAYAEAANISYCVTALFEGRTPRYIEVHISGVVLCPIATTPNPNGTFILTQFNDIFWNYEDDDRFMQLELHQTSTVFVIAGKPGLQFLFYGVDVACVDHIDNDQVDCLGGRYGHSGSVKCYWGPGISP